MAIELVRAPLYGPGKCPDCEVSIIAAVTEDDAAVLLDPEPVAGGGFELYTEHFPDGSWVEPRVQRVRPRPDYRPPSSPAWRRHFCQGGRA